MCRDMLSWLAHRPGAALKQATDSSRGWQLAVCLLRGRCIVLQHGGARLDPARFYWHVSPSARARNAVILKREV